MNYNRILVTGGAGFIGSNLSLKLIEKGYKVTVLDNLSEQVHGKGNGSSLVNAIAGKVTFIKGDVRNSNDWVNALKNIDIVVHLAAETGTGQSMYDIENYVNVNIGGTAILLNILANESYKIKKIIVASSRAIYGEGKYECKNHGFVYPEERKENELRRGEFEPKCPFCKSAINLKATDEESKIHPTSIYGITKQAQEQLVMNFGKMRKIPCVAFRYQNVYGPGQSLKNPYTGILSIFSNIIKNGGAIQIFEDGHESRDFVFIDDVVKATVMGIESDSANYEIFNVGSGINTDVLTVASTLQSAYKSDTEISIDKSYRLGDIRHNYADITKIITKLGFEPKVSFEEGIALFSEWVNQQKIQDNNFNGSLREMKEKGLYWDGK